MDCFSPYTPADRSHPRAEFAIDSRSEGYLGLREWNLISRAGRIEMGSIHWDSSWSPADQLAAECPKAHRAGRLTCTCGFHIHLPTLSVARELEESALSGSPLKVIGAARGWGRLTLAPNEIRAEYATVEAIFVHKNQDQIYQSLAEQLSERYEAELIEFLRAEDILEWLRGNEGVLNQTDLERILGSQPLRMRVIEDEEMPWIAESIQPVGLWPETVDLPRSSNEDYWPDPVNPLGIYPVAGMVHHLGREPENTDLFRPGCQVSLIHEPENPFDSNAIAVFDHAGETQLGYLPRNLAREITSRNLSESRAFLLCTWHDLRKDDRPFSAHVIVAPDELADQLSFNPYSGLTS